MLLRELQPLQRMLRRAAADFRARTLQKRQTTPNQLTQDSPATAGNSPRSGPDLREHQLMYA